jgi:hypothetical protein
MTDKLIVNYEKKWTLFYIAENLQIKKGVSINAYRTTIKGSRIDIGR